MKLNKSGCTALTCFITLSISPFLTSCGSSNSPANTTQKTQNSNNNNSNTNSTDPFTISSYSPASGTTTIPSSVTVAFTMALSSNAGTSSNWTYSCTGGGTPSSPNPTSIVISGSTATLTLPSVSGKTKDTYCTLSASGSITDTSGDLLSGATSAVYGGPTSSDNTSKPYTAYWNSPSASLTSLIPGTVDQTAISGTLKISVSVLNNSGTTTSPSSLQFVLNSSVIGTTSTISNNLATATFNSLLLPNGKYILHVNAYDADNNLYSDIATPISINIQNLNSNLAAICNTYDGKAIVVVNSDHTETPICQISKNQCPGGMMAYGDGNWTTTSANTCLGGATWGNCGNQHSGTTGYHLSFTDTALETVLVPILYDCGPLTSGNYTCKANITSIGCVLP